MKNKEFNEKCAKFLGWEYAELSETFDTPFVKLVDQKAFGDDQFSSKLKIYELDFDKDWNWLHIVKYEICKLDIIDEFETNYNSFGNNDELWKCKILLTYKGTFGYICEHSNTEMLVTVLAIDKFLDYYNNLK